MTTLTLLPNFSVLIDSTTEFITSDLLGIVLCFCEEESWGEHVHKYKIKFSTVKCAWIYMYFHRFMARILLDPSLDNGKIETIFF